MFGRKGIGKSGDGGEMKTSLPSQQDRPGHSNVLAMLTREETQKPDQREQLAGHIVCDLAIRMIANDRGVRAEELIALLASTGGFSCSVAALKEVVALDGRHQPNDWICVKGNDGLEYVFGDLPNRYLVESEKALLSLALGAVMGVGGKIEMDDVHSAMKHVAGTVGAAEFGVPRLPAENMPWDFPVNYALHLWFQIQDALDLYECRPSQRPAAIGFALQEAINKTKDALDPRVAGLIAIECSVATAKISPGGIEQWKSHWESKRR